MKLVICRSYGSFDLPKPLLHLNSLQDDYRMLSVRSEPNLVKWVEEHPEGFDNEWTHVTLKAVEIPDDSTDYLITDCDGVETVYYVVNGKIKQIY